MPSAFQKVILASKEVSGKTGRNFLCVMSDLIYSKIRYKCDIYDYTVGKFYRLSPKEREAFLTSGRTAPLYKRFNDRKFVPCVNNKSQFHQLYKDVAKRAWIQCDASNKDQVSAFIRQQGRVFAKPNIGTQGFGIAILQARDVDDELLGKLCGHHYLLEEVVEQDERMSFGGKSVNTLRVYTVIDKQGRIEVIKALFRVGVGDAVVDNFHQGGVVYPVDLASGIVEGKGVLSDFEPVILIHPGTDRTVVGFHVPRWQEVLETVRKAASITPALRYLGWDVAVTKTGIEIIEGNDMADMDLLHLVGHKIPLQYLLDRA